MACAPLSAMRIDNIDTPYFPKVTFPEGSEKPVVTLHEATSYVLPGGHATYRVNTGQRIEAPLTAELFPVFSAEGLGCNLDDLAYASYHFKDGDAVFKGDESLYILLKVGDQVVGILQNGERQETKAKQ
jgi:hypothetical protein